MSRDYINLNRMKQTPRPPYAPDLAPWDFSLLGYVKGKLMGYRVETPSELIVRIRVSLAEIPRETMNAVWVEWMERLQKCVQVDGEYVGCAKRMQYIEIDFNRSCLIIERFIEIFEMLIFERSVHVRMSAVLFFRIEGNGQELSYEGIIIERIG
jgi:hypothetical protein